MVRGKDRPTNERPDPPKGKPERRRVRADYDDDSDYHKPDDSGYSRADEEWFFGADGKP